MVKQGKIDGVKISKLKVYKDRPDLKQDVKPGIFIEVLRDSDKLLRHFAQSNFAVDRQGSIKAFHYHKYQDDLWFFASGKVVIVLYDQRKKSPTYGQTQVIRAGEDDYKLVLIPIGVAHGYKVISKEPSMLFYHVTKEYNREKPDEQRIDPFDKEIGVDWKKIK
ncbi:MAG: dTDP-4-dehydrorhamnose 3,5-epimerase family protein [bacterium]